MRSGWREVYVGRCRWHFKSYSILYEMGTGWLLISGGKEKLILRWEGGVFTIQMPQNLEKKSSTYD